MNIKLFGSEGKATFAQMVLKETFGRAIAWMGNLEHTIDNELAAMAKQGIGAPRTKGATQERLAALISRGKAISAMEHLVPFRR